MKTTFPDWDCTWVNCCSKWTEFLTVKNSILGGFAVRFSHIKHESFELKLWLCTECVKPKEKSEADF